MKDMINLHQQLKKYRFLYLTDKLHLYGYKNTSVPDWYNDLKSKLIGK